MKENKKKKMVLEVISDEIFSFVQLKDLYQLCGRFDIKQKLNFEEIKMF